MNSTAVAGPSSAGSALERRAGRVAEHRAYAFAGGEHGVAHGFVQTRRRLGGRGQVFFQGVIGPDQQRCKMILKHV